ncbi:hypothetical protein AN644_03170 [Candidatus Epulonipiscium fishelsonii]|nr:hypothetical protein AN644_03170 [Epulopiscium sp. SCG-C06WGA-EpuloA1]
MRGLKIKMDVYSIELAKALINFNTYDNDIDKLASLKFIAEEIRINASNNAIVQIYENEVNGPFLIAKLLTENSNFNLLLDGHVDVVSPEGVQNPFEGIIKDDILFGRGACDMKGGCASLISAFIKASHLENQHGNIYLVLTMDEEFSSQQVINILSKKYIPTCDFALIAEPTELQIITAHKGNAWVDVEFIGKTAHASAPEKGINAIVMASDFINELTTNLITSYENKIDETYGVPTLNIGVINGGTSPNVVPATCNVRLDHRYFPGDSINTFINDLNKILSKYPDTAYKLNVIGDWASMVVERDNEILLKIKNTLDKTLCKENNLTVGTFWGEGGFIQAYGTPTVYYGPGSINFAHTPHEQVKITDIVEASTGYFEIIKSMCF